MFEIIFGSFWTAITAFITIATYTAEHVTVNDVEYTQAEFSTMLFPKVFLGIFWFIGLFMLYTGLKKIIKNHNTNVYGEIVYGKICNIYNSGTYINEVPELKADFLIYVPSEWGTKVVSEVIGLDNIKNCYQIGDYVEVKYYNNDINIIRTVTEDELPYEARPELVSYKSPAELEKEKFNNKSDDSIYINGEEYIRRESVNYDGQTININNTIYVKKIN